MARFNKLEFQEDKPEPSAKPAAKPEQQEKRYRNNVDDWMREADTQRRLGIYEPALRAYGRALECRKSHVEAWVGQAQMLVLLNEPRQAEMWSISGLKVFPSHADLHAARAQALCRLGSPREAMAYSDVSIQGDGNSPYRWTVRGELMLALRSSNADHCFDSAEQVGGDWLIRIENANILRFYHAPLKAMRRAAAAVNDAPDAPFAWTVKGLCEYEAGFSGEARKSLGTALQLDPVFKEAKNAMAAVEGDTGFLRRLWSFIRRR